MKNISNADNLNFSEIVGHFLNRTQVPTAKWSTLYTT